jgi:hypothetical protein
MIPIRDAEPGSSGRSQHGVVVRIRAQSKQGLTPGIDGDGSSAIQRSYTRGDVERLVLLSTSGIVSLFQRERPGVGAGDRERSRTAGT